MLVVAVGLRKKVDSDRCSVEPAAPELSGGDGDGDGDGNAGTAVGDNVLETEVKDDSGQMHLLLWSQRLNALVGGPTATPGYQRRSMAMVRTKTWR